MKVYSNTNNYWSFFSEEQLSDVKTKWSPKEGLFTQNAESIARYLLKHSSTKAQAVQRINFYINRAGDKLSNKAEVLKAKRIIENSDEKA